MRSMSLLLIGLIGAVIALFVPSTVRAQVTGVACNNTVVVNGQAAATVKVVADPAGTARVFVCGWNLNAGAAVSSFQFQGGTGAACAGSNVNLTGQFNLPITGSNTDSSPVARGMATAPSSGLCLVVTGTGPLNGVVFYAQQ